MNLNPETLLSSLINVKEKIDAPDIIWTRTKDTVPKSILIHEIITSFTAAPGKLIVIPASNAADDEMKQSLLYIPSPDKKFHFVECRTIQEMRSNGREGRYILTNNATGYFEIFRDGRKVKEKLYVCKNCLYEWNYKGYQFLSYKQQNNIVQNFDIKEFFTNCKPLLQSRPLRTGQTILKQDEYDRNWDYISKAYRASKGWCCEICGVNLSDHTEFLHTHHINGNKYDISFNNLQALCFLCHSEQPHHRHMIHMPRFIQAKDLILQRRQNMEA